MAKTMVIQDTGVELVCFEDPFNKRIRIDHYLGQTTMVIQTAEKKARECKTEKLIIKGLKEHIGTFLEHGFQLEAIIDEYFLGTDAYFYCKYYQPERSYNEQHHLESDIVSSVHTIQRSMSTVRLNPPYTMCKVGPDQTKQLATLYQTVFQIYPTPLNDPEYIKKTMDDGTIYYAFFAGETIISAASAEINPIFRNAELTDCATLKEYRKFGLMKILLEKLELELVENHIFCTYSLARSLSFGMNAVLHQLGYHYRGRLTNNCFIFDKLEDMNVWVKNLSNDEIAISAEKE